MIRVNFYLTERQTEGLKAASERTGLTVSELIRRAIDAWLAKETKAKGGSDE